MRGSQCIIHLDSQLLKKKKVVKTAFHMVVMWYMKAGLQTALKGLLIICYYPNCRIQPSHLTVFSWENMPRGPNFRYYRTNSQWTRSPKIHFLWLGAWVWGSWELWGRWEWGSKSWMGHKLNTSSYLDKEQELKRYRGPNHIIWGNFF